jgi:hypothetical protein
VLLLVLILVLIAFGLLVVALLSGSVLWAWVSVAVSVAAAAVLLADWLQRRSAVRAGTDGSSDELSDREAGVPSRALPATADIEPVTEVLPALSPAGSGAAQDDSGSRFDNVYDGQQTVVMPIIQPSGSSVRPPGADGGITASSGDSSRTVTGSDADHAGPTPPGTASGATVGGAPDPADEARPDGEPDPQGTVTVPAPAGATAAVRAPTGSSLFEREPAAGTTPAEGTDAPDAPDGSTAGAGTPRDTSQHAEATAVVDARTPGAPDTGAPGPVGIDTTSVTTATSDTSAASDTATSKEPAATDPAAAPDTAAPDTAAPDTAVVEAAPPDSTRGTVADAEASAPLLGPDGDPPEEPRDPTAAAIVAGLEDEILVIDEQPRYHVGECPSLAAMPLIPLPVREAVELGFTPCGWCSPDRTLADRHRAAAR